jgi:phosphotransferase system HPr (HPr) family protein
MKSVEYTVKNNIGLHARPAAIFVKKANEFTSKIEIKKEEKTANAKSIINVMSLGAVKGSTLTIQAKGEDECEAVDSLVKLLDSFVKDF